MRTEDVPEDGRDLYPEEKIAAQWKHDLAEAHFPWESAQWIEMPKFLSEYTVHDSYWISFLIVRPGEAIALITWDTSWSAGRVYWPEDDLLPNPVLAMRFLRVYEISWYGPHTMTPYWTGCISGAESREGTGAEFTRALEAFGTQRRLDEESVARLGKDGIYYTQFYPCLAGDPTSLSILHGGKVGLLCLNHLREVVPIPDLE